MLFDRNKLRLPDAEDALEGRKTPIAVPDRHFVHRRQILPPFPDLLERAVFGMGCFWGAEKAYWPLPGVYTTAVGYSGGLTPNPTYKEVCTGRTGHAEVVLVVFDPGQVTYEALLKVFFEKHDPTQGMRQGNDVGTQYRSAIYVHSEAQRRAAEAARAALSGCPVRPFAMRSALPSGWIGPSIRSEPGASSALRSAWNTPFLTCAGNP